MIEKSSFFNYSLEEVLSYSIGYVVTHGFSYDIEKAKQLLDDAGWTVGDSGYREKDGKFLQLSSWHVKIRMR